MAGFEDRVQVDVSVGSPTSGIDGFGVPLYATPDVTFPELFRVYKSASDVNDDALIGADVKTALLNALSQPLHTDRVLVGKLTALFASIAADLDALRVVNDDWYFVSLDDKTDVHNTTLSAWAELNGKLCMLESADVDIIGAGTGIAKELKDLGRTRTAMLYHAPAVEDYPNLAWPAYKLQADPDIQATSWDWTPLTNIAVDKLSSTEVTNAEAESCNMFTTTKVGRNVAGKGILLNDRAISLQLGLDWVSLRLNTRSVDVLIDYSGRNSQVPQTNAGYEVFGDIVRTLIAEGIAAGWFVAGTETVTVPKRSQVSDDDLLDGIARIAFDVQIAGAVKEVRYTGFLIVGTT